MKFEIDDKTGMIVDLNTVPDYHIHKFDIFGMCVLCGSLKSTLHSKGEIQ